MRAPDHLAPFLADRAAALRSLDAAHIRAYARKWGARLPAEDGPVFWARVELRR